jgi:hypothetical protein
MHFRYRNHIVQVIRTTYDPATKKPRTEIVGRLQRTDPKIDDELRSACTPAEVAEVERWVASQMKARAVAAEHAAWTLGEQFARAAEWFAATPDDDAARVVAAEAQQQWVLLRNVMRRRGLLD